MLAYKPWQKLTHLLRPAPPKARLSASEIAQRYPRLRWQMLEATFLGYASYYLVRTNLPNAATDIKQSLGYSQQEIGLLLGATGLAYGIGKFVLGGLSDRSNPKYLMPLGLLITTFINLLFGSLKSFPIHLFLWSLNGFVQGVGWGPCGRILGHWFSVRERGRVFGIWNIAHNIGGGLTGLIAGYSAEHWGWSSAFYIPAMLTGLASFYLFVRLRDTPVSEGLPPIEEYHNDYPETPPPQRELSFQEIFLHQVLKNRFVWLFAITNYFVYIIRYSLLDWGPTYLVQFHGARLSQGGWTTFFYEVAAIPSTIAVGYLSDYLGGRRALVSILCLIPIFLAFTVLVFFPPMSFIGQIILFSTVGFFIYPPVMLLGVAGLDFGSAKAVGAAAGFIGLWGYLGKASQASLLAWLSVAFGWPAALAAIAASVLVAIVLLMPIINLRPKS